MNKTKLKILSGAQQMFYENSFHGTALDKLLGSIKVSKGSFFHHFRSKDDLLLELLNFEAANLFEKLQEFFSSNPNPLSALNNFFAWRLENYQSTGRLIYKLGAEAGKQNMFVEKTLKKIYGEYLSYLMQILNEAKSSGQLIEATPVKELASFIIYGLEGASTSIALTDNEDHYADIVEMMKRVIRSYRNINFDEKEQ